MGAGYEKAASGTDKMGTMRPRVGGLESRVKQGAVGKPGHGWLRTILPPSAEPCRAAPVGLNYGAGRSPQNIGEFVGRESPGRFIS